MHHLSESKKNGWMRTTLLMRTETSKKIIRRMTSCVNGTEKADFRLKSFFNTSGLLYKSMKLKDKLPEMSEDEMLMLLATDGMLVKRPIVITDDIVLTGFKPSEWEKLK